MQWGRDNEEAARFKYKQDMHSSGHVGLLTKNAGFIVNDEKCWLGVSPYAWVNDPFVDHNFDGIAEFKCPYTMADKTPDKCVKRNVFTYTL